MEGEHTPTIIQLIRSTDLAVIQFKDSHIYILHIPTGLSLSRGGFLWMLRQTQGIYCWLPQEGFGGIHLQLMRSHDIEYCLQLCYVITFGTTFYRNIVYVEFHCFAYMFVENYIVTLWYVAPAFFNPKGMTV